MTTGSWAVSPRTPCLTAPGPWEHRYVAANGARFHVAELGEGPLVLLLHGSEQFWWTWRHQLPPLAEAGFRVVAMDLRGFGASDHPPRGYDIRGLVADVASVVRSLGHADAVVVGHGLGACLAWAMPNLHPAQTRAVAALSMPHPAVLWRRLPVVLWRTTRTRPKSARRSSGRAQPDVRAVGKGLRRLASPTSGWPDEAVVERYAQAMAQPFAARTVEEIRLGLLQATVSLGAGAALSRVQRPVAVPVLQVHGADDRFLPAGVAARSARYVEDAYRWALIPGAGHYPHEETPQVVSGLLRDWLLEAARPRRRIDGSVGEVRH